MREGDGCRCDKKHYDVESVMNNFYRNLESGSIRRNHIFKFSYKRIKKMELKSKTSNIDPTTQVQRIRFDKGKTQDS